MKPNHKVLIVCNDADNAPVWTSILQQRGFIVVLEASLRNTVARWEEAIPDLVVIDVDAAQAERVDACRKLREGSVAPLLLFLPAFNEKDIIEGYQAGADECVIKPVSPAIFLAKIRAWARRSWTVPVNGLSQVHAGRLVLDPAQRAVVLEDGGGIKLTNMEYRLLQFLMGHAGQVLEASRIVHGVWGSYGEGDSVLLKNVIYRLRKKLEDDPRHPQLIQTHPGGYSFQGR